MYQQEQVTPDCVIGEYWNDQVQIDLVSLRQDNVIDLGECKWGRVASIPKLLQELNQKIQAYPNKQNATLQSRLFLKKSRKLPADTLVKCYSLQDLYEE